MAEPKNPALAKLRDWAIFQAPEGTRRKAVALDGQALARISDLIMERVAGTSAQKLAWLRQQSANGKLDGDDPEEIAEAEALLKMLARLSGSKGSKEKRHLAELLDEGLKGTFPASDPVSIGRFTSTEPPSRPVESVRDSTAVGVTKRRRTPTRKRRVA